VIARRFVYDPALDAVVELLDPVRVGQSAGQRYAEVEGEYRSTPQLDRDAVGRRLRNEALDRADRREFSHKRYGDEGRWSSS
jgi:hypothetical protein